MSDSLYSFVISCVSQTLLAGGLRGRRALALAGLPVPPAAPGAARLHGPWHPGASRRLAFAGLGGLEGHAKGRCDGLVGPAGWPEALRGGGAQGEAQGAAGAAGGEGAAAQAAAL